MFKILRKADIVLFFVLLALGIALSVPGFASSHSTNRDSVVEITLGGRSFGEYPLNRDEEIEIEKDGHLNLVIIKDGKVHMEEASCYNQVCIKQGTISRNNQSIVCLPNRVVVRILAADGDGGGEPDVVVG